jgi:hypothetical protein
MLGTAEKREKGRTTEKHVHRRQTLGSRSTDDRIWGSLGPTFYLSQKTHRLFNLDSECTLH